jgi:hypothetical protein
MHRGHPAERAGASGKPGDRLARRGDHSASPIPRGSDAGCQVPSLPDVQLGVRAASAAGENGAERERPHAAAVRGTAERRVGRVVRLDLRPLARRLLVQGRGDRAGVVDHLGPRVAGGARIADRQGVAERHADLGPLSAAELRRVAGAVARTQDEGLAAPVISTLTPNGVPGSFTADHAVPL